MIDNNIIGVRLGCRTMQERRDDDAHVLFCANAQFMHVLLGSLPVEHSHAIVDACFLHNTVRP